MPGDKDSGRKQRKRKEADHGSRLAGEGSDLLLEAQQLQVEEIGLELAKILKLEVKGLETQLYLEADLDRVASLLEQVLTTLVETLGDNPELLRSLLDSVKEVLGTVGDVVEETVGTVRSGSESQPAKSREGTGDGFSQSVEHTTRHTVDKEGDIITTTVDEDGEVLDERITGNLKHSAENEVTESEAEATDAAERRAGELGVDLSAIEGTGSEGRVLVKDVEKAAKD